MLIITLVFAALSIGLFIWMYRIASKGSPSVRQHVLERWKAYTRQDVVEIKNNPEDKRLYLSLLFPWDVFFMIAFGIFLALASIAAANLLKLPCVIIWAILPFLYVLADFTENCFLYQMLKAETPPDDSLIARAHLITRAKWVLVIMASLQAILLIVFSWF
jgi:hypothetical protein